MTSWCRIHEGWIWWLKCFVFSSPTLWWREKINRNHKLLQRAIKGLFLRRRFNIHQQAVRKSSEEFLWNECRENMNTIRKVDWTCRIAVFVTLYNKHILNVTHFSCEFDKISHVLTLSHDSRLHIKLSAPPTCWNEFPVVSRKWLHTKENYQPKKKKIQFHI